MIVFVFGNSTDTDKMQTEVNQEIHYLKGF